MFPCAPAIGRPERRANPSLSKGFPRLASYSLGQRGRLQAGSPRPRVPQQGGEPPVASLVKLGAHCVRSVGGASRLQTNRAAANVLGVRSIHSGILALACGLAHLGCVATTVSLKASPARRPGSRAVFHEQSGLTVEGAAFFSGLAGTDGDGVERPPPVSRRERCPPNMALVRDRVCIDRWEASLVLRNRSDGTERGWSPYIAVDGHESVVRAISEPGVIPQAYISGRQAALACKASGKRLCTAEEWVSACRGPENHIFPYGDTRRPGACNDDSRRVHPVIEAAVLLGIPTARAFTEAMNQAIINQLEGTLLPTGTRTDCTNAYGVFDMVGNLHEWVDNAAGTFRGGYYMDTTKNGDGCSYQTTAHGFSYHDYSTGFRCCIDAEGSE